MKDWQKRFLLRLWDELASSAKGVSIVILVGLTVSAFIGEENRRYLASLITESSLDTLFWIGASLLVISSLLGAVSAALNESSKTKSK